MDIAENFRWPQQCKYADKLIGDTPSSYLRWAMNNWNDEEVAIACEEELAYRDKYNCHTED